MRSTTVALVVVIGILGGFYAGWKYSQAHVSSTTTAAATNPSTAATGGAAGDTGTATGRGTGAATGGGLGNAVSGQITAVGNGTITVHDRTTNKDVTIAYQPTVRVVKSDTGSTADLSPNTQVTVIGQADSSGTVQATAITIGTAGAGGLVGGGGGRGRPSPSPSS